MKAYLCRADYFLLGLEKSAQDDSREAMNASRKAQIIAKSDITLHLGPQPQVRCRIVIDDDEKTGYELWKVWEGTHIATNSQAIQNPQYQLDSLLYKDGANWDEHFSKFMNILAQLASLDEEFSEKDKISRFIVPSHSHFLLLLWLPVAWTVLSKLNKLFALKLTEGRIHTIHKMKTSILRHKRNLRPILL